MANLIKNVVSNGKRHGVCCCCSFSRKDGGGNEKKKFMAAQDTRLLPTGRQLASCANGFHVRYHVYD